MTGVFYLLLPRAALANLSPLEGGRGNEGVVINEAWQFFFFFFSLATFIPSRHSWFQVLPKQPVLKINRYCMGTGF